MALKPCRECGKEFSTEAAFCPNCGAPGAAERAKRVGATMQSIGCVLTLLITIPFLIFLFVLILP